ncbi:MAG TPA: AAA family ATPase, partial [Streptosporangiaceae bacterium]|nr:AAA family ATPase [Streptosporangiaceae bacterium]
MPGPGELPAPQPAGIIGRDAGLARLGGLVDPVPVAGQVLVVTGEAGMGKTVLLADAAGRARSAGLRVLSVTGRESESRLAFAGLHQLLRSALPDAAGLPARQARALRGALGLSADPGAPDPLLTGAAVLTLLSDVSERSPVLVVADDAHWLDRSSLDALAFAGSRLDAERVVLLVGARGQAPPPGFDRGFPELHLEPLSADDAGRLLDGQPHPPRGRARAQVLAQAAGNPMALIELAKVIAEDPSASRRWAAEPLPPTERLTAVLTSRFATLPEQTQAALLLAAVADGPDLSAAASHGAWPDAQVLAPAEQLGLIKVDRTGLRFSHPLVRSAIYHSAPFAQRAAAHRDLASALHDQPDRRAWHLAAAALQPDEDVASLLEATAAQAQYRGGALAAALAMERAAELSPDPEDQARRLVAAASAAVPTGQGDWVQDLAARALAVTADPGLRLTARHDAGWALAWSGRRTAALSALISVAEDGSRDHPDLAWDALGSAATVAYQSGTPASRQAVSRTLGLLERQGPPASVRASGIDVNVLRLWIRASTDPIGSRNQLLPCLRTIAGSPIEEPSLWRTGSAAWILDESDLAARLLQDAMQQLRAPGVRGTSGGGLTVLGWVYVDTGRWDEALDVAAEAASMAEANQMELVAASADVIAATVLALRADSGAARRHAARALATVDPAECGLVAARARRALGVAALADGSYLQAFTQLRGLFGEDGRPLHNYASYLGVADIAAAAVRADRRMEGQDVIERALSRLDGMASPRLEQLIARARGILAGPDGAEAHFDKALCDPAGDQWPFERAQLRLDYAEWLRRRRRINDAKPVLTQALGTFRRLRARSWVQRAEAELRACGVAVADAPGEPDILSKLTPQQRQIVRLASDGLTNREIGDRLFLSPRTVSSHLYRSYPKLGVA